MRKGLSNISFSSLTDSFEEYHSKKFPKRTLTRTLCFFRNNLNYVTEEIDRPEV